LILYSGHTQREEAEASLHAYQQMLTAAGYGTITTEIAELDQVHPFYYAEDYHQQYLAKNPGGYCGAGGTGVACPVGLTVPQVAGLVRHAERVCRDGLVVAGNTCRPVARVRSASHRSAGGVRRAAEAERVGRGVDPAADDMAVRTAVSGRFRGTAAGRDDGDG